MSEALAHDGSVLISDDTRPPLSLHGNAVESRRSFSWNQRNENRAIGQPMENGRPARQRDSVRSTDDDGKEEMKNALEKITRHWVVYTWLLCPGHSLSHRWVQQIFVLDTRRTISRHTLVYGYVLPFLCFRFA